MNLPGTFIGTILNYENIGKTRHDLAQIWNYNNPADPIQILTSLS